MKNKIIIIEGAQGVGKSTITNWLREHIPSSTLLRLTGISDKSITGEDKTYKYHQSILQSMIDTADCDMNYIWDRSFLSEFVYCRLGYKPYNFEKPFTELCHMLEYIAQYYDVYFIHLYLPDRIDFDVRLSSRDKCEYERMEVMKSWDQQLIYADTIDRMIHMCAGVHFNHFNSAPSDLNETIMEFCGLNEGTMTDNIKCERMG